MTDLPADPKHRARALFNLVAPEYDTVGPRGFAHFGRRLVELAGVEPGHRVLDVATGRGAVLFPAAERAGAGGEVVGVDLAEEMVAATAREIATRNVVARTVVMDAEALDFPGDSFDRVFCGFGIMFLPDRPRAIGEFRRVLRRGGRAAVSTWRDSNAEELHGALVQLGIDAPRQPGWITDPEALGSVLHGGGFDDVEVAVDPHVLVYADVDEYLATARTTGVRRLLDRLDAATWGALREVLAARLEPYRGPGGLHVPVSALVGIATR